MAFNVEVYYILQIKRKSQKIRNVHLLFLPKQGHISLLKM